MAVGLDTDTEYIQRGSIPSGGAGTLSDGGFTNCFAGVWLYRPSSGNSYGLTSEGSIIHFQAGAREVRLGFDNTFGAGTAADPLLQVVFNSGGGTGAAQTFAGANFLDEWVYYFILDNSTSGQIVGYIRLSDLNTAVTITRTNDNAGSQYINTLTFGNSSGGSSCVFGWYAYARALYATGITVDDVKAWAASSAPDSDWGFWDLDDNADTADTSGNSRTLTFNGTLTSETSPTLGGGGGGGSSNGIFKLFANGECVCSGLFEDGDMLKFYANGEIHFVGIAEMATPSIARLYSNGVFMANTFTEQ